MPRLGIHRGRRVILTIPPLLDQVLRCGGSGENADGMISLCRALLLVVASVTGLAGQVHAQPAPQAPLPPPPQRSQLLPRPGDQPGRPQPPRNDQPPPRVANSMGGLIDYMDRPETQTDDDIDAPVTGFGNEALWEPFGRAAQSTPQP